MCYIMYTIIVICLDAFPSRVIFLLLFFSLSVCQMLSNSHEIFMSFYDLPDFCIWMWTLTRRPVLYCLRTVCTTSRPSSFATLDQILKQLKTMLASTSLLRCVPRLPPGHSSPFLVHRLGLVIDGRTLAYALDKSWEDKFLAVARSCRSVLCCRSTPLQKSMVVKLVRNKLKVMTLAIVSGGFAWSFFNVVFVANA